MQANYAIKASRFSTQIRQKINMQDVAMKAKEKQLQTSNNY